MSFWQEVLSIVVALLAVDAIKLVGSSTAIVVYRIIKGNRPVKW